MVPSTTRSTMALGRRSTKQTSAGASAQVGLVSMAVTMAWSSSGKSIQAGPSAIYRVGVHGTAVRWDKLQHGYLQVPDLAAKSTEPAEVCRTSHMELAER